MDCITNLGTTWCCDMAADQHATQNLGLLAEDAYNLFPRWDRCHPICRGCSCSVQRLYRGGGTNRPKTFSETKYQGRHTKEGNETERNGVFAPVGVRPEVVPPRGRRERRRVRVDVPRESVPVDWRVGNHASGAGAHDCLGHVGYCELRVELAEPRLQLRGVHNINIGSSRSSSTGCGGGGKMARRCSVPVGSRCASR